MHSKNPETTFNTHVKFNEVYLPELYSKNPEYQPMHHFQLAKQIIHNQHTLKEVGEYS